MEKEIGLFATRRTILYDNGHEDLSRTFESAVRWGGKRCVLLYGQLRRTASIFSMTEDVRKSRRGFFPGK